jgi:hypothetical protein
MSDLNLDQDLIEPEPQAVDLSDIDFSVEAEDWIDVSALREMYHPFNSQVRDDHELTSIQRSIQKNGFTGMMIVVNKWNGKIVSGHGKVEACFKAGYRGKLPVVWREYKGEIEHRNAMLQFNMASGHQDPEKQRREIEALLAALPAEEVTSDLAISADELQRILGIVEEGNPPPSEMWQGMPEFEQEDTLGVFDTIKVNFSNADNMALFFNLIGQDAPENKRTIWYPKVERKNLKAYVAHES